MTCTNLWGRLTIGILLCLIFAVSVSVTTTTSGLKRNVTSTFNEGCHISFCKQSQGNSFVNFFHVTAKGDSDAIHFLWSSYGALTGLVARTTKDATLNIDWKKIEKKESSAITFQPKDAVLFSSATILSRLIDFDDSSDTADLTKAKTYKAHLFEDLDWKDFNQTISHSNHSGTFVSQSLSSNGDGSISLMVQGFPSEGRSPILPRLSHTSNSSYFELALENIATNFTNSRFAVELVVIGGDKQKNGTSFSTSRSIADSYTPAVFYVDNINFPKSNSSQGGFVSWKPVTYTEHDRHLSNGRLVHEYGLKTTNLTHLPSYSLAHAFYGDINQWDLSSINISFGNDGDGFYKESNYTVWGGLIGYGKAPVDGLSLLIIIIISVGLGLPALLILGGGSVMCVKRIIKRRKDGVLLVDATVN